MFAFSAIVQCILLGSVLSATIKRVDNKKIVCHELSDLVLSDILGPAFNSRYMSIDQPVEEDDYQVNYKKRKVGAVPSFYVEDDYTRELGDEPAWNVNHLLVDTSQRDQHPRYKRSPIRQWECESRIEWIDLGADYFPRYLRSVECTTQTCWYGHYKCKPRSFTVKLLRRKRGRCTVAGKVGTKLGIDGLPAELRELWVWEERAVNFCCDCSL